CTREGLDISGTAIGNNFCRRDPAQHREEIRKAKEWIARYALLGAKTLRVFAGPLERGDSEEEARRRCAEALLECCTTAGQHGILLALENHGGIVTTADQMLALVQMVEHEWFGVNLDTGNFRTADPYGDVARLAPHAVTVQVKTEIQVAGRPKETADLGRLMDILRQANYRGTVVLEYEAKEDPKTAIPTHAADLRELMRR
ncbi:MAG TPA: sugar phosphate isomerase/epimerase family protein, partial [Gemmatales bacterium]|nr:sugar phosphate isomerase/epimerase family protein [Gemmatales bacterium]